ncbi:MAG TPA: serine hydrolase domain-containing protein [Povalibacter sp.]|uniref:serine hydrolase domain-containing protein n=1 Tax=Povalibacter sp. TaxID=1962978 RepID=UPI002CA0ABA7|nr:serine hydrolase domain-containing protein [Povalibacter sp.]HMN46491.1 serine hydrolase domain-containing protein [Povalibacter sp.]
MRIRTAMLLTALIPSAAAWSQAAPAPAPPPPAPDPAATQAAPATTRALTREDAEAWLDGFLPYALKTADIAGAVVVIVKDGQVLLQKGYGYADVEARKPVDPENTLFRPGSVSKLFTWTAVMQLVEQGKLDLDADVNNYLDFQIPPRDGQPVTLRNVLTHTAGLEEQVKGLMGTEDDPVEPIGKHLAHWIPERIYAPGTTPAYSNYATALAGYIVERVSGQTFDDYIDQHLLAPLGMQHSSFRQPLPDHLKPLMSKGYARASQPAKPFEVIGGLAPAGSLAASGADMGKFMIAHLQNGAFGETRILQEETAKQMHGTALTILPRVNRMLLGFYEQNYNGHRALGHGGDTQWFHSNLHLFIDDNIGLFFSVNSAGKAGAPGDIRSALFEEFADRYLPGPTLDGKVDEKTAAEHARLIAGAYQNSRRMDSSFLSLLNLLGTIKVVPNEDGTITVSMATNLAGVPIKWREVEPFVWRDVNGNNLLSAEVKDGRVTRFSFGEISPFMIFERVPASRSAGWLLPALCAGLVALLLTALAWPVSALVRRHYGVPYALTGQAAKSHRWIRIASTAGVVLMVAWAVTITTMMGNFKYLSGSVDGWLWVLQLLSLIAFPAAAVIGLLNAATVLRDRRKWYTKVWAVVLALALLVLLWVAYTFHLIALDVNY